MRKVHGETGERAPFVDPDARASLVGLTLDHDRCDVARAHLEGLAYAVRDCVEAMNEPPRTLVVCGGASASELVCQLLADVLGQPVEAMGGLELGTLGADVAARAAVFGDDIRSAARQSTPPKQVYHPDHDAAAFYAGEYAVFHTLREQAKATWATLSGSTQSAQEQE